MNPDLTFIMCAYNEARHIQKSYAELLETLKTRKEKVEILFVDNDSTDGTRQWLKSINNPCVRVFFNEKNIGKGGSIKKGIVLSTGKYVAIHDPDYEYRAADVWKCYDYARQTQSSFVLGSRVLNGKVKYQYYLNYIGVIFLTFLINMLYGCKITDSATAMKLFDGDLIRRLSLRYSGFDVDFELVTLIARLGGKITEVSVDYYPRTIAEGKKIRAVKDGLLALKAILVDRFIPKRLFLKK